MAQHWRALNKHRPLLTRPCQTPLSAPLRRLAPHAAHLERLLANRGGCASQAKVRLRHHSHVGDGQLQRAAALLLRNQARHGAVDLRGRYVGAQCWVGRSGRVRRFLTPPPPPTTHTHAPAPAPPTPTHPPTTSTTHTTPAPPHVAPWWSGSACCKPRAGAARGRAPLQWWCPRAATQQTSAPPCAQTCKVWGGGQAHEGMRGQAAAGEMQGAPFCPLPPCLLPLLHPPPALLEGLVGRFRGAAGVGRPPSPQAPTAGAHFPHHRSAANAHHARPGTHLKVLLGMSPSTFSRSKSTGVGVPSGASASLSTTRPLPSMVPMTCGNEGGGRGGRGEQPQGRVHYSLRAAMHA